MEADDSTDVEISRALQISQGMLKLRTGFGANVTAQFKTAPKREEVRIITQYFEKSFVRWVFNALRQGFDPFDGPIEAGDFVVKEDVAYFAEKNKMVPLFEKFSWNWLTAKFRAIHDVKSLPPGKLRKMPKDNSYILSYEWSKTNIVSFKVHANLYKRASSLYKGDQHMMDKYIILLYSRYDACGSTNNHLAVPPDLLKHYKIGVELFGSPFNTSGGSYCSPFPMIERHFGSLGSFFDFDITSGIYVMNPPYDELIMEAASRKILSALNGEEKITIMVVFPMWDPESQKELEPKPQANKKFVALDLLNASDFIISRAKLTKDGHPFFEYYKNAYQVVTDAHLLIVSNTKPVLVAQEIADYWKRLTSPIAVKSQSPKEVIPRGGPPKKVPGFLKDTKRPPKAQPGQPKDILEDTTETMKKTIVKAPKMLRKYRRGVILGMEFEIDTPEKIRGVGRCNVTEPTMEAATNSVCDPRMGALLGVDCASCGKSLEGGFKSCQGHPGYIELAWPIFNPIFITAVVKILRLFCFRHYRDYIKIRNLEYAKLEKEYRGRTDIKQTTLMKMVEDRLAADPNGPVKIMPCFDPEQPDRDFPNIFGTWRLKLIETNRECKKCVGNKEPVFYSVKHDFYIEERIGTSAKGDSANLDPKDVLEFFKAIDNDTKPWAKILGFGKNKLSSMISTVWSVMGNPDRPDVKTETQTLRNSLSAVYVEIVKHNKMLKEMQQAYRSEPSDDSEGFDGIKSATITFANLESFEYVDRSRQTLTKPQTGRDVYNSLNVAIRKLIYDKEDSERQDFGQRRSGQVLSVVIVVNGKPGILRKDVMGKGSDHGGRTVIIGDNNIDIDEIGITRVFADVLTKPEKLHDEADVAKWTAEMPHVVGGKKVMGRILKVIKRNRGRENEIRVTPDKNIQLEVGDTIRRRLVNGDIVVISRQPVLHKGGMMGFRIRIFEEGGNVLRLHPAVAGPFNADYDGDEMNFSVPQDPDSVDDVFSHMMVGHCIRGDKYSTPWIGMIQNPVIAAHQITQPDTIIERTLAKRLIDIGLETFRRRNPGGVFRTDTKAYYDDLSSLKLGIIPSSGRALMSFFMPMNFNYERRKGKDNEPVIVERGYLLSGVMDKGDIGKASNGMIDAILNRYGPETVIVFISALNRALYEFISADGYTIGIRDCVLPNLSDGSNPQDTIDNLVTDTSREVVAVLERGRESGYLAQQAEARADKLLAELGDRINIIVKSGGVDTMVLESKLNGEKQSHTLHEILEQALKLNLRPHEDNESTSILLEMAIMEATQEAYRAQIRRVLKVIKDGKRDGNKNRHYNEEMHILRAVAASYEHLENVNAHFEDISLAMLAPTNLKGVIVKKLLDAAMIRSELVGASKFDNRLLTVVYSGAKGTGSNVLQAMGSLGPQEKSFIGRDETMQRSLPFHEQGALDPIATHFVASSYAKGLNELEYWNHAAATRANIITAKLSPADTGFFYRRAICLTMDIYAEEDGSSRDENGRIVQFMYGGDGFDATRLTNVTKSMPPQFINVGAVAKNLRTNEGLGEYELK